MAGGGIALQWHCLKRDFLVHDAVGLSTGKMEHFLNP
jgi:hypothetical protein